SLGGRSARRSRDVAERRQPYTLDEARKILTRPALPLVEAGETGDHRRRVVLREPAETLSDARPALADRSSHEDRVERPFGAVVAFDGMAGEADVADVMLPARVRAAADLHRERPDAVGQSVAAPAVAEQMGANVLRDAHRARDRQR